jgi:hypothetical protein
LRGKAGKITEEKRWHAQCQIGGLLWILEVGASSPVLPGQQPEHAAHVGNPGRYPYEFRLDNLAVTDDMLERPVFEMVKRRPVMHNPANPTCP